MKSRLRLRITLKASLVLISALAIVLGVWGIAARTQREAAAEIIRLGGDVEYHVLSPWVEQQLGTPYAGHIETIYFFNFNARYIDGAPILRQIQNENIDTVLLHAKRLPLLKQIVVYDFNHSEIVPQLREALPGVTIEVRAGGML